MQCTHYTHQLQWGHTGGRYLVAVVWAVWVVSVGLEVSVAQEEQAAVLALCCCGLPKPTQAPQSHTHTQMHSSDHSHALCPASMSLQSHMHSRDLLFLRSCGTDESLTWL